MNRSPVIYRTTDSLKEQLAKNLHGLLKNRAMRPSDLMRKSGLSRGTISTYMRRQSLPTQDKLTALEQALDLKPGELLPGYDPSRNYDDGHPVAPAPFVMSATSRPGYSTLTVNTEVPTSVAMKVIEMISNDNASAD